MSEFQIGMEFDQINEQPICTKYIPRGTRVSNPASMTGGRQARVEDKIVDGQFRLHIDTAQLRRNTHCIEPHMILSISDKWHGTSAVFSHILVKRDLSWIERMLQKFGIHIQDQAYGHTWSSRRVVKGVDGEAKANSVHFYSSDIWGTVAREIREKVPAGFTLYGEIVGYTPEGKAIQCDPKTGKAYHYGCQIGSHRFLVYRVTSTNIEGKVIEFSWAQMKEFCSKFGLDMVKELYYGRADGFFPITKDMSLEDWQTGFLNHVEGTYVPGDAMCQHNNFEIPAEGVVVKVDCLDDAMSYKVKSFLFLERESQQADKGIVDMETEQSEVVEEAVG